MISVIIPVYNNDKYIARCLDSVLIQTNQDFEALVINDGSQDRSGEIIRGYADRDMRIHYFEQENQGVSVARNKGLNNATGDYVLFLDGDDWLDSDVLERLVATMVRDDLDCVSYRFRHVYEDGTTSKEESSGNDICYHLKSPKEAARFFDTVARHVFYTSQQHLFRRKIIEEQHLRFAPGIKCGEDGLFAHMYSMFIEKGIILSNFCGYNYYHHKKSCVYVNTEPWENDIFESLKCCIYFSQYLTEYNKIDFGGYELSARCWETLLHVAKVEVEYPNVKKCNDALNNSVFSDIVYPYILNFGRFQRRLLVLCFRFSRGIFRYILKIK